MKEIIKNIINKYRVNELDIINFISNNPKRNKKEVLDDLEFRLKRNISIKRKIKNES